jgi:hypothetical protein
MAISLHTNPLALIDSSTNPGIFMAVDKMNTKG